MKPLVAAVAVLVALRAPSVRADPDFFTVSDRTMPPTSLDIGFSPNPCPRKPEAPHSTTRRGFPLC